MSNVKLTGEQIDGVVAEDLKTVINDLLDPINDPHETAKNKKKRLKAFLRVLEYYMKPSEFAEYTKDKL